MSAYTVETLEAKLVALIEQGEYAGRQDMLAKKTTGNKIARNAREMSDVSSRYARLTAHQLAVEIVGQLK